MACVISFLLAQNHYAVQHIDQQLSNVSFCVIRVGSPFPFLSPVDKTTIVLNGSLRRALTRRLHRASVLRGVNKIFFFHFAPHHRLPLPPRTQRRQASKFLSLRCDQRFLWLCTFIFSPSTECFLFLLPREPTYLGVDDTASQERIASLWVHDVCPTGNRFSTVGRRPVGRKASKRTESGNERVLLVVLNAHPHRYLSLSLSLTTKQLVYPDSIYLTMLFKIKGECHCWFGGFPFKLRFVQVLSVLSERDGSFSSACWVTLVGLQRTEYPGLGR